MGNDGIDELARWIWSPIEKDIQITWLRKKTFKILKLKSPYIWRTLAPTNTFSGNYNFHTSLHLKLIPTFEFLSSSTLKLHVLYVPNNFSLALIDWLKVQNYSSTIFTPLKGWLLILKFKSLKAEMIVPHYQIHLGQHYDSPAGFWTLKVSEWKNLQMLIRSSW